MFSVQSEGQSDKDFAKEVAARTERLGRMMQTEGWREYEAYVRGEAAAALRSLRDARSGDEALKAGTAYTVLMRLVDLPREQYESGVKFLHTVKP